MGLNHSPRIITDGLVLCLDAGNTKSYPGSGTTWTDLSGNGNSVTATNSPTWNSAGYFSTGATGYFTGSGTASIPIGNSSYTMMTWIRINSSWTNGKGFMSIGGLGIPNQSNALMTLDGLGQMHHYWWDNDLSATNNNAGLSLGKWFMATAQFDGTTRRIWANITNVASNTPTGHNVTSTTIQIAKTYSTEYLNDDIAIASIYNRALTAAEVQQNFNALRGRFGI